MTYDCFLVPVSPTRLLPVLLRMHLSGLLYYLCSNGAHRQECCRRNGLSKLKFLIRNYDPFFCKVSVHLESFGVHFCEYMKFGMRGITMSGWGLLQRLLAKT